MSLQKNYPYSAGKGSKHIHIRYFFVVDKIEKKEIKIIYCPTEDMVADYSTKPLQGGVFEKHRNAILGITKEDFTTCKMWYKRVLVKYDLWNDEEEDLRNL